MKARVYLAVAPLVFFVSQGALAQTDMQPLRESMATVLSDGAAPVLAFRDAGSRNAFQRWQVSTGDLLKPYVLDAPTRSELVQTAWYESKRAGLEVSLVLGLIEVMSSYRKFAATPNGALGYMAVNPSWSATIGDGDVSKLFHTRTNLRFGCVILRHYLDLAGGDTHVALAKYLGNNLALTESNPKIGATINRIYAAAARLRAAN